MIAAIMRTGFLALRRDRGAFLLSFILPVAFFSIFAVVTASMGSAGTARVSVLVVDQDRSAASRRLVDGLLREPSLAAQVSPKVASGAPVPAGYTAASAESAVKQGSAPVALIIPAGFGASAIGFGRRADAPAIRILRDPSDPVASQVVAGMLEKVAMTSLPDVMAGAGVKYLDQASGGLTPQQHANVDASLANLAEAMRRREQCKQPAADAGANAGGLIAMDMRDVVGENKRNPMISFYAAGIGVMFLLFTASAAAGSLLDEAENGTLDRILSTRVSMTSLLAGKMLYCTVLAFSQLTLMFLWGAAVFHLDLFTHLPGFFAMTAATSFAVASFGMLLATVARTRAQQAPISTLVILTMSAIGGSMFPRFLMPEAMKKVGLLTFNAWAIDGYTKVFWRDEPVSHLRTELTVLTAAGVVLFLVARRFARKWEYA